MKLHNTFTGKTEQFQPLNDTVRMYSCGPTVYDHIHIGNLRTFIMDDMKRRTLSVSGYTVAHVMNFTDVDDKTIQRSQQDYPDEEPMEALGRLTRYYGDIFLRDTQAIGNDTEALTFINATDAIPTMQSLIRELHENGFAYIADDGVYFSIEAYQNNNKTYGQLVAVDTRNTSASRINNDEYDKDSVHDFALWKTQQPGEPAWEFTLDGHELPGRPGWHIECSAMSTDQLGQPFDIHTGGVDLMFPHHENEIAQSTAGKDEEYARYFMHNEHLLVENRKMAKSEGSYITLPDIEKRGFDPLAFRLLTLQAHYRSRLNFTWDSLGGAQAFLRGLQAFADLRFQISPEAPALDLQAHKQDIREILADDVDTPRALAALSGLVDKVAAVSSEQSGEFDDLLSFLDDVFGLKLAERGDITPEQKELIHQRDQAKQERDYPRADALRDQLREQNIILGDTPYGTTWQRSE